MWAVGAFRTNLDSEVLIVRSHRRNFAALAVAALATCGLTVVAQAPPAQSYNVCSDDNACVHEKMSAIALGLLDPGSEAGLYAQDIWDGAGHEDGVGNPPQVDDHIFGYPYLPILKEAVITMPHFWDADSGDETKTTYGDFEEPLPIETLKDMWEELDILDLIDLDIFDTSFIETANALAEVPPVLGRLRSGRTRTATSTRPMSTWATSCT